MIYYLGLSDGDLRGHRWGHWEQSALIGFLFSFHYCRKTDMAGLLGPLDPQPPLFADSGAFTAHTQGKPVELSEYAGWLEKWDGLFDHYANLDVLNNVRLSAANQRQLEKRGLQPVPVFHGGEDWAVLRRMVKKYDYVALGGIAAGPVRGGPLLVGWLERCFQIGDGLAEFHGFGMTNWQIVQQFPWRSVDSSSIGSGYRYGTMKTYDPYAKRWRTWKVADRAAWGRWGYLVREYGLTPGDFAEPRTPHCTRSIIRLSTRSMQRAIEDLPPRHQYYMVENPGKQNGPQRSFDAVSEVNRAQVYVADTSLPGTKEVGMPAGTMRLGVFNDANRPAGQQAPSAAAPAAGEGIAGGQASEGAQDGQAAPQAPQDPQAAPPAAQDRRLPASGGRPRASRRPAAGKAPGRKKSPRSPKAAGA